MPYRNQTDIDLARAVLSPPGDTLLETIEAKGMNQAELARRMDRPTQTINEIIQGKASITPHTAIQLEYVLGIPADFWLERERLYQLQAAILSEAEQQLEAQSWANSFPLKEMSQLFGLTYGKDASSKVRALLSFFQVSNVAAYRTCFENQYVHHADFRMSESATNQAPAMAAWLRQGEIQAQALGGPAYNKEIFLAILTELKALVRTQPTDVWKQIQARCLVAGVRVVFTPCLPKAALFGSTRWLQDRPLIQLSNRYRRNDIFWFTFFHEVGHILLHGKKDVFIEGLANTQIQSGKEPTGKDKEDQANEFAAKQLLPRAADKYLKAMSSPNEVEILRIAEKYQTHPAIVLGRMAHLRENAEGKQRLSQWGWNSHIFEKIEIPYAGDYERKGDHDAVISAEQQ